MTTIQRSYSINPADGFPGVLAEPSAPHHLESGLMYVPASATRNPRPGDAVYYDTTENAFAIPTTAAQSLLVCGILSYRADKVANASSIVEYLDGEECEVGDLGTFWVTAGAAMEYGQIIAWDRADFKWDPAARVTAIADIVPYPIVCASRIAAVDTGIAKARIGYGRVI